LLYFSLDDVIYTGSYRHASLSTVGWPWPPDGEAIRVRDEMIQSNLRVSPLPAYNYEDDSLILPEKYNDLRNALVVLHFNLVWNYFKNEEKDSFSVLVRRIEVLDNAVASTPIVAPSPSKRSRISVVSPSPPRNRRVSHLTLLSIYTDSITCVMLRYIT